VCHLFPAPLARKRDGRRVKAVKGEKGERARGACESANTRINDTNNKGNNLNCKPANSSINYPSGGSVRLPVCHPVPCRLSHTHNSHYFGNYKDVMAIAYAWYYLTRKCAVSFRRHVKVNMKNALQRWHCQDLNY